MRNLLDVGLRIPMKAADMRRFSDFRRSRQKGEMTRYFTLFKGLDQ